MKRSLLCVLFICTVIISSAQIPNFNYVFGMGTSCGFTAGNGLTHDAAGNIYVSGSYQCTIDADPGAGVYNLNSNGWYDAFLAKYNSNGQLQWAFGIGSPGDDGIYHVAVDALGNVYVTGYLDGVADFNPAAGTATLAPSGVMDIFLAKYNSSGAYQWAFVIGNSASYDWGHALTVDGAGNPIVGGIFTDTVDFNPGAGVNTLICSGGYDAFVAKYNGSGIYQWALPIGSPLNDYIYGVTTDAANNVFVTGYVDSIADFDPSVTTVTTNVASQDMFLAKYTSAGNYSWAFTLGASGMDQGGAVDCDGSGNVYVTGYFSGTVDFDPGVGTSNLNSLNNADNDAFVAKYNNSGTYQWAFDIGNTGPDAGAAIYCDASSNIYVSGLYGGLCDFDPGVATSNLTTIGIYDAFIAKYNSAGNYIWAFNEASADGSSLSNGAGVTLDNSGNLYSIGAYVGSVDFDPSFTSATINSTATDFYLVKYSALCSTINFTFTTTNATCPNNNDGSASVTLGGGVPPYTYSWSASAGSQTTSTASNLMAGVYGITVSDVNSCLFTRTVAVNAAAIPTPTICMVTVDSIGTNNVILWDKAQYAGADSFYVYRDIANNNYKIIGKTKASATYGEFQDTVRSKYAANGDPRVSSWKYKIAIKDSCGNLSALSPFHKTLFTQNSSGNFSWNDYQIEGQPIPVPALNNYVFRRDNNGTGNWQNIQTLSASSGAYTDPSYAAYSATADWRIETVWSIFCFSNYLKPMSGKITKSRSNIQNNKLIGIHENTFHYGVSVYPNPTNGFLNIEFQNVYAGLEIHIINVLGEVVYSDKPANSNAIKAIDMSVYASGVYTLLLSSSTGKTQYKIVVD